MGDKDPYFYGEFYGSKISRLLTQTEVLVVDITEGSGLELVIPILLDQKTTVCVHNDAIKKTFMNYAKAAGADNIIVETNKNYLNKLIRGFSMKESGEALILNANTNDQDVASILKIREILSISDVTIPRVVLLARDLPLYMQSTGFMLYTAVEPDKAKVAHEALELSNDEEVFNFILRAHQTGTNTMVYCESSSQAAKFLGMNRSKINMINSCEGLDESQMILLHDEPNNIILTTSECECSVLCEVRTVIDYPMTTHNVCTYTGGTRKRLRRISKIDSKARKQRASRCRGGMCYRLYFKSLSNYLSIELCAKSSYVKAKTLEWEHANFPNKDGISEYDPERNRITSLTGFGTSISNILSSWIADGREPYPCLVMCALVDSYMDNVFMYPLAYPGMGATDHKMAMGLHQKELLEKFGGRDALETMCKLWTHLSDGRIPSYFTIKTIAGEMGVNEEYLNEVRDIVARVLPKLRTSTSNIMPANVLDIIRDYFGEEYTSIVTKRRSRIGGYTYNDEFGNAYEFDALFPVNMNDVTKLTVISSDETVAMWIAREETFVSEPKQFIAFQGELVAF